MRRLEGRVISVMLLLALGIALCSVALGSDFGPPGHYDGDEDDVGLIWRTLPQAADVPVIASQLTFIFPAPAESVVPGNSLGPRRITRDPFGSRAPPA
jgi:hypothetical protein